MLEMFEVSSRHLREAWCVFRHSPSHTTTSTHSFRSDATATTGLSCVGQCWDQKTHFYKNILCTLWPVSFRLFYVRL